jgi:DNA/RNA-binding domain of Phe-tRNA-synthetase-like protein
MMEFKFNVGNALKNIVKIGIIQFDNVTVVRQNQRLIEEISSYCSNLRTNYPSTESLKENLQVTRKLYKSLGLDPTKNRPSSEALIRRVIKGKSLYQINSIVDICNLSSIHFLLSIGLYDVEKVVGKNIELRIGNEGEGYAGIGKEYVNVSGRFTLSDKIGPFGNPSADSDRTKITMETKNILFVVFAPVEYEKNKLKENLDYIESKVTAYHDCSTPYKIII